MRKLFIGLVCIGLVLLCGLLASCDGNHPTGSGGAAVASVSSSISGPDTLAIGASGQYKFALTDSQAQVAGYEWAISGVGRITKNKGSFIVVQATAAGVIKIKLRVKNSKGVWSPWDTKKVAVAQNPTPDPPTFVVTLDNVIPPYAASGLPATGTAATWSLTGSPFVGTLMVFFTSHYTISFSGDVSGLPDTVPVTVSWQPQNSSNFYWGSSTNSPGSGTWDVPKATGGSIGQGGTSASFGVPRPYVVWDNPPFNAPGMVLGTVTFSAPGVQTLTITVTNANIRN